MRQNSLGGKGVKTVKAFLYASIIFAVLVAGIGLLIRFSPLPERWAMFYLLTALCIACLFLGLYAGNMMKKGGILYGALFAVAFTLLILVLSVLITGTFSEDGIFQIRYLLCIIFGSIGGMVGVNLRTS